MSAPTIIKVAPNPYAEDVVLGSQIVVTFDQLIDTTTVTDKTFSLTGPGTTKVISPEELNLRSPRADTGREYIPGTFAFTTVSGHTVVTFTPSRPLRPNAIYTVLVVGATGSGVGATIQNLGGDVLNASFQWNFTSGDLNVSIPPITSPLPQLVLPLDPALVKIQQKIWAVGNDLSQEIDIIFPAPIDTSTVTVDDIMLSLEAILNDPMVAIPSGLTPAVTIAGNTITIVISGWPNP